MDFKSEVLIRYPFLKEMDKEELNYILDRLIINHYKVGDKIFSNRQTCSGLSLIMTGRIRVYKLGTDGKEITLYRLNPGDNCFNTILCALTDSDDKSFAEVEENSEVAIIPMDLFKKYILNNNYFLKYIFKNLYDKFENVVEGLEKVTFDSIEDRILKYFKEKIKDNNTNTIIYTTHEKLAYEIGSSREVVSRKLKELEKRNIIELTRGKIKVLKTEL